MSTFDRKHMRQLLLYIAAATAVICIVTMLFYRTEIFAGALKTTLGILMPFIYGAAIAYLLHPVCGMAEGFFARCLDRKKTGRRAGLIRMLAILVTLVLLLMVIILLILAVLPEMIRSVTSLLGELPSALERFSEWIKSWDNGDVSHEVVTEVESAVDTVSDYVQNFLQTVVLPNMSTMISNVTSSFRNIVNVLMNFGLGCIIAAYFLGGWEKFKAQLRLVTYALFPRRAADFLKKEAHIANRMLSGFVHGKVLDSFIIGVICFIFMLLARMPYAVLVAVLVGVTNMIPFFGPYLGAIPSALLILTVSPAKCAVFLVFIIILQQVDGNVIGPKILGNRLGLSSFWILFAILVFGKLFGLPGMLLGVPVFAVIYDLMRTAVFALIAKKREKGLKT